MHYSKIKELNLFVDGSIRMIDISRSQGIQANIGKLKDDTSKECAQSYTFNDKWTSIKMVEWIKEHEKKTIDEVIFLNKDIEIGNDSDKKIIKYYRAKVLNIDKENKTIRAVVNDDTLDRDNEVNTIDSWDKRINNFKAHPVLLSSHNYKSLQSQIGIATNVDINKQSKQLIMDFKYFTDEGNKEADWAWKLAEKGIAMFSVGYIPHARYIGDAMPEEYRKLEPQPRAVYTDNELLEVSQVVVGSNRGALQMGFDNPTIEQNQYAFDVIKSFGNQIPDFEQVIPDKKDITEQNITVKVNVDTAQIDSALEKLGKFDKSISKINKDSIIISPVEIQNMKELQQIMDIIKSGRVISEKNRTAIKSTVDQLNAVIIALNALIEITEPKQEEGTDKKFSSQVAELLNIDLK